MVGIHATKVLLPVALGREDKVDDLVRLIRDAIKRDGHLNGCEVVIQVNGGTFVITGRVHTFYQKSLAQSFVMRLVAEQRLAHEVHNDLEVR